MMTDIEFIRDIDARLDALPPERQHLPLKKYEPKRLRRLAGVPYKTAKFKSAARREYIAHLLERAIQKIANKVAEKLCPSPKIKLISPIPRPWVTQEMIDRYTSSTSTGRSP